MSSETNTRIGERVRYYRTARNLSLEELASRLTTPLAWQQLQRYEKGESRWPADLLLEISAAMVCDVRQLLGISAEAERMIAERDVKIEQYVRSLEELDEAAREFVYDLIRNIRRFVRGGPVKKEG